MLKRKNRFHRWLAMALALILLAGQSNVSVLAQEDTASIESGISEDEKANTDEGDADEGGAGQNGGNDGEDNEDIEREGADGQDKCVCETVCTAEKINGECPVCAADYDACVGNDAEEGEPPADINGEETISENDLHEEADIVPVYEGVETYAVGDHFLDEDEIIFYYVTDAENKEVMAAGHAYDAVKDKLVIPKTVIGKGVTYRVTSIGKDAFWGCSDLTEVTISDGVISIGESAFQRCINLQKVEIPESVKRMGYGVFSECSSLISATIPNSITRIESGTFVGCSSLTSIEIPKSVTSIGNGAFWECSGLTSVEIPDSVTSIEGNVFVWCSSLTSIKIPKSVTSIGEHAFANCSGLTSIEIPEGITNIEESTFSGCSGLTSIKIPESVTSIGSAAFSNCSSLGSIEIPKKVTSIGRGAFFYCSSLGSMEIPQGVTSIEDSTFAFCSSLDSIEIPSDITSIGEAAFRDCTGLGSITIPNSLEEIGPWIFFRCAKLEKMQIVVPSGEKPQLPKVGDNAFTESNQNERFVVFLDGNGDKLVGPAFEDARNIFSEAEKRDGWNDGRWYGWSLQEPSQVEDTSLYIKATATEGGMISPAGDIPVTKGEEQTFTITPDEGNKIKEVTVDGGDVTGELADNMARAQTGAKYYTFTNVTENHMIHAVFESDGSNPSGGDESGGGGDNSGGDGGESGGGGDPAGENGNSGGSGDGDVAGNAQTINESKEASPQAVNYSTGNEPAGNGQASVEKTDKTASGSREPKTGDTTRVEIYATIAMIAGLTYLLLYFMDEGRGMTEREKEVFVAAFIRWAKKGGAFRRGCAIVAIFCLLVYYHSIGKRVDRKGFDREYLRQAL